MANPKPAEGTENNERILLVRRDVSPEEIAVNFGALALTINDPGVIQRIADTYNGLLEVMTRDMAAILGKRQRGEMDDKEYAFWKSCYPDLP